MILSDEIRVLKKMREKEIKTSIDIISDLEKRLPKN